MRVKKRISFYSPNRESGVDELTLLADALEIVRAYAPHGSVLSVEDYIRGVVLDHASRVVAADAERKQVMIDQQQLTAGSEVAGEMQVWRNETGDGVPTEGGEDEFDESVHLEVRAEEVVAVVEADAGAGAAAGD